jgi:hypothetical protein
MEAAGIEPGQGSAGLRTPRLRRRPTFDQWRKARSKAVRSLKCEAFACASHSASVSGAADPPSWTSARLLQTARRASSQARSPRTNRETAAALLRSRSREKITLTRSLIALFVRTILRWAQPMRPTVVFGFAEHGSSVNVSEITGGLGSTRSAPAPTSVTTSAARRADFTIHDCTETGVRSSRSCRVEQRGRDPGHKVARQSPKPL